MSYNLVEIIGKFKRGADVSIANIQYIQKDINKYKYKKLSRESFDEVLNYQNLYSTLPWCLKEIFKWNTEKIATTQNISGEDKVVQVIKVKNRIEGVWLNKNKSIEICKKNKNNIDLITALFDDFDYSDECLSVLNLLSNDGAAILYVPALEYKKIQRSLSKSDNFYVNAIFGSYDERDSENVTDQEYVLPESYKCLAIIITRIKTDLLYLWLEYSELDRDKYLDEDEDEDEWMANDLSSFFQNNLLLTNSVDIHKEVISANRVVVESKSFNDIEGFYIDTKINQEQGSASKFPEKNLSDICKIIANGPIAIMNFLKCIDDGVVDIDKWNSYIEKENNNKDREKGKESSALFELMTEADNAKNYIPEFSIKRTRQICIIEVYSDDFKPPYFRVLHPHEWSMGEFKFQSTEDNSLNISILILNPEIVTDNYLFTFLKSEIGKLSQKKALVNLDDYFTAWKKIKVLLPDINQQEIISSALDNANNLQHEISTLKDQLITNPEKSGEINKSLKDWLKRLDRLSLDEKILGWIKDGESDVLEFKETLSLDIEKRTKEKYIELSSLKTITGFLNSKGGVLLVGVSDDGACPGVFTEVEKFHKSNFDDFLKYFKNRIKARVGEEYYPYIEYQLVDINESKVLYVNCGKSEKPCYLDGKDFYVRTNPATDKLEGPKLVNYIKNHFGV